jgi:hypothetical protein
MRISLSLTVLALCVCFSGCKGEEKKPACIPPKVEMTPNSDTKWHSLCVTCHGKNGRGDGPAGRNLDPGPRNFSSAEWQKSMTDAAIMAIIVKGGVAVGKSKDMPPSPELEGHTKDLESLVRKIRSLGECQ